MRKPIIRKEYFWFSYYNPTTLSHSYITDELAKSLITQNKVDIIKTRYEGKIENILVAPIRVYYEATKKCNLSCRTCFNSSGKESTNQIHSKEVIKILEWFRKDWVLDIRFTWWEFTQREWRDDILKSAKNLWFIVSLNTNGVFESNDVIQKLAELNLDQITISIDWREESHNKIRTWWNWNNFVQAINSIKQLSSLWANVRINTVLNNENYHDVPKILDFAGQYCQEINFFAMRHIWRANWSIKKNSLNRESFDIISKEIAKIKKKYPNLHTLYWHQIMQDASINPENEYWLKYWAPDWLTRFNITDNWDLYAWWYTPYINKDSLLLKLGNAKDEWYSLLKTWHESEKLNRLRIQSWKLKDICAVCEYKKTLECPWWIFEMELQKAFWEIDNNPYCSKDLNFIDINSLPK